MQKRNVALLFSVFLVLVGQLFAQSGPSTYVYVSTYTGGQILRVNATTGAISVVYTGSSKFLPDDLTVGPDNRIYVCDPTNGQIIRMNDNGTNVETVYNQPTGGPQGPRFSSTGTLFFNTKTTNNSIPSGVWKIDGLASVPLGGPFHTPEKVLSAAQTGEGLAFTNRGDLLIVNQGLGEVQCLQGPHNSCPGKVSNLTDPIGIAVNSIDEIFVAGGNQETPNGIQRHTVDSNDVPTYVDFSPADQPKYFEFFSDDTLFVATADEAMQNGKLWKVTPPASPGGVGSKTLLATLPKRQGKFPPAVGVGVPATSKSITKEIKPPEVTKVWNFGPHSFELTAGTCTATITACQRPPEEVNTMLATKGRDIDGKPKPLGKGQPLSGEEGWVTTWLVQPSGVCSTGSDGFYEIAIGAFVDAPFSISPGIVKCDGVVSCDGSPTVCTQLPDFGYYPQPGLIPGDPVTSTKSKSFSEYLFVNLTLDQDGKSCGFQSPLIDPKDPGYPAVFNVGKTVTFKFQLTTEPNCAGKFITDAKAVLSVAQIDPSDPSTFVRMDVKASGGSNDPPFFRNDNPSKSYVFNLDTSGSEWTPGLYTATVTSNKVLPQTIQFRLK
jgi:hypothetical protein